MEKPPNISLVFNSFTPKFMINLTLGRELANNQIEQYSYFSHGVLNTTYDNIVRSRWTQFSTFMNYAMTKNTRIMPSMLELDYGDIRLRKIAGIQPWMAGFGFPWTTADTSMGTENGVFSLENDEEIYASSLWRGFNMFNTTLSKTLLKDKLDISPCISSH